MANIDATYDGAVVSICATPQSSRALNRAGFEALTFVDISKVVTVPAFHVTQNSTSQSYVGEQGVHLKGGRIGSETSIVVGPDEDDTGQDTLDTASGTKYWYAMKIEYPTAVSASFTNTIDYAVVSVYPAMKPGGGESDAITKEYEVRVQGPVVTVASEAI